MPNFAKTPRGAALFAASLIGMAAMAPAFASDGEVLVSQSLDHSAVVVDTADLDLTTAYDRDTLQIRIDNAARAVCDINGGSKIDRLPDARACFNGARESAMSQLAARGVPASALAGG
ncbi:UrcA family protein [Aurantiacibacter suaedae]|uniref:UrcA family protein n=1 Tax=Aurantiacibacter suaedae TaxID=2545755 RepID=UPI0010F73D99|nr:UrcA family protein [Aurantiacibacter suaedae]